MISYAGHLDGPLTPLVVRSGYSMLRGTAMPQALAAAAKQMGHTHLALTDVNGLYGATVFHQAAKAEGIEPIIGAELQAAGRSVVALVHSQTGYENLCGLITRIHCSAGNAKMEKVEAKMGAESSGGMAAVVRRHVPTNIPETWRQTMAATPPTLEKTGLTPFSPFEKGVCPLFPGDLSAGLHLIVEDAAVAMELLDAGIDRGRLWLGLDASQSPMQLRQLGDLARDRDLQTVLTAKALLARKDDMETARLLAAIRTGKTFAAVAPADLPPPKAYLRGPEQLDKELAALLDPDDFTQAADNNLRLARQCAAFKLLPRQAVFPDFPCPDGLAPDQYLRRLCMEGLARRYAQPSPEALARLDKELGLIVHMGFCEYFLVVWDIVRYARSRGGPVAGRGSGASSLAAYLLGITNVCPLAHDIPFERFLHAGREDFPDLDVDFCWRIRDDVIDYAFRRWGAGRVAMVSMHNTFQMRSALRETAKAFGMSDRQISGLERWEKNGDSPQQRGQSPVSTVYGDCPGRLGLSPVSIGEKSGENGDSPQQRGQSPFSPFSLARRIVGLPRNISVHPGGIVIAPRGVDRHVPIEPAAKGVLVTQLDKDGIEDIRLVKLDLLGNRNLSTVRYACDLIARRRGIEVDVEALPPDDEQTVRLLQEARTIGCNQLESPAMRHLLRMMQPHATRDVMKALALIRPGAASIGMKEVFIRRHRGLEQVPAEHAEVAAVLGDTHGVMLYEDDVMLVAAALLRCDMSEADRFRKSVQKCRDDAERLGLSEEFLRRCRARGVRLDYAKDLWVQMAKFNAYSFCRAHAASYAVLAYAGAYLKAHYPLEFWAAALNNNQSMYPARVYVEQAKRQGVRFLLPDVNRSEAEFSIDACHPQAQRSGAWGCGPASTPKHTTLEGGTRYVDDDPHDAAIRVGLGQVDGLGQANVQAILDARRRGPFAGLSDCLARTSLGRNEARALVLCGAFGWTARARPTLMMELNLFYALGVWRHSDAPMLLTAGPTIPNVPGDYPQAQKYLQERQILGLSVGEHILAFHRRTNPSPFTGEGGPKGRARVPSASGKAFIMRGKSGVVAAALHSDAQASGAVTDGRMGRLAHQPSWGQSPKDGDSPLVTSRDLPRSVGRIVRIAGMLEAQRTAATQKGDAMMFLTMDDEYGVFEVTLFPDICRAFGGSLGRYGPYVITGKVEEQYGAVTVTAQRVELIVAGPDVDEGA